jgi:hypothetical protein
MKGSSDDVVFHHAVLPSPEFHQILTKYLVAVKIGSPADAVSKQCYTTNLELQ